MARSGHRVERDRFRSGEDGEEAGPGAPGGLGREPRGAGHARSAADDGVAAPVFVILQPRSGQIAEPQRRVILEAVGPRLVEHPVWNSDVGDQHLAAMDASGEKQVPRLLAEESHREARTGSGA
jgi:hypothetical protein